MQLFLTEQVCKAASATHHHRVTVRTQDGQQSSATALTAVVRVTAEGTHRLRRNIQSGTNSWLWRLVEATGTAGRPGSYSPHFLPPAAPFPARHLQPPAPSSEVPRSSHGKSSSSVYTV